MAKPDLLVRSRHAKALALYNDGRLAEAEAAYARICQASPADVLAWTMRALTLRRLGQWAAAENCCQRALAVNPRYADAYKVRGQAQHCQGRNDVAVASYRQALGLAEDAETHYLLANVLREAGELREAAGHYREALRLRPGFLAALSNLGALLLSLGESLEAADLLNRALALAPDSPQVLCNLGHALLREGRLDEALVRYQRALALNPDSVDAVAATAALLEKKGLFDEARSIVEAWKGDVRPPAMLLVEARLARRDKRYDDAINLLESALAGRIEPEMASEAHMLLGQLYDKQKKVERAYPHLVEGNRLASMAIRDCQDNGNRYLERIAHLRTYLTPGLAGAAHSREEASPIFLLGFPRSGTTLLEQILDSHPALLGLEEKATVSPMVQAFERMSDGTPEALARLDVSQVDALRQIYFAERAKYASLNGGRQIVDKLPLNTVNVHLIWRVFPDARFILAIRHPCDACFSCFMQNFAINEAMASFFTLMRTAEVYDAVMRTWVEASRLLPLRYHRIRYEDLIDNFEGETRALLDFLGVGWDESVRGHVEHAARRGTINTPSYHQVTQPIYQDARYRWKRYASHFGEALPLLHPYIKHFGYAD